MGMARRAFSAENDAQWDAEVVDAELSKGWQAVPDVSRPVSKPWRLEVEEDDDDDASANLAETDFAARHSHYPDRRSTTRAARCMGLK